jgi:hypothetical protein
MAWGFPTNPSLPKWRRSLNDNPSATSSPAEELRAAADKLRMMAAEATAGPWNVRVRHLQKSPTVPAHADFITPEYSSRVSLQKPGRLFDAQWQALMHPGLADPIADWLESEARQYDLPPCNDPTGVCNRCEWNPGILDAIRVARAINGTV